MNAKHKEEMVAKFGDHFTSNANEPAVYVGTYRKYNNGSIYGAWVNIVSFDKHEDFIAFCNEIHKDEEDPELMFQDHENFPDCWYYESGMDKETFDKIIKWNDMDKKDAFEAYLSICPEGDLEDFEDRYCGEWDSEEEYAQNLVEELYPSVAKNPFLSCYFDYEKFARDLFFEYDFVDGYVFSN